MPPFLPPVYGVVVDELGGLILPDYITPAWKRLLEKNTMRVIRFHDLRHPYVKLKLKVSSAYFRRIFSTKILDFPLYFKSVVGINAHLFNEHIRKSLCQSAFFFYSFCSLQHLDSVFIL